MEETVSDVYFAGITRNLVRSTALDGVSLLLEGDEYVSLFGPSGSGRPAAAAAHRGLREPDAGTVSVFGQRRDAAGPRERGIGFVFQSLALFPPSFRL